MSIHTDYLTHSPYYAAMATRFGRRLSRAQVEAACALHSTTVASLVEDMPHLIDAQDDSASTLDVVMALGY